VGEGEVGKKTKTTPDTGGKSDRADDIQDEAVLTHDCPLGSDVDRRDPIILLKINVTAKFNQLFRDERMPIVGSKEERSGPILHLNFI
jgi:hypothetical protein